MGFQQETRGRDRAEFMELVLRCARQFGVVEAQERYGVPREMVEYWLAKEVAPERPGKEKHVPQGSGSGEGEQAARRKWRVHSAAEKAAAVADRAELGVEEAARVHGVCPQTIRNWCQAAKVTEAPEPETEPKTEGTSGFTVEVLDAAEWERVCKRKTRVGKRYTPTEKAAAVAVAVKEGVAAAARKAGATPQSVYRWLEEMRRAVGEPVERTWEQTDVERQRDLEILHEWHKQPGLGPSQIRNQLRRRGIHTSVLTVRRVMTDAGYRPPKVKSQAHHERYEAVRPNAMWHLDFLHRHIHKAGTFTLILLDDYSRFVVGHAVDDAERADTVIACFEEAVSRHGKPEAVMSDKGSAFWSWRGISRFTALLEEMGIDQYLAEKKEWNGKVEKFNADLAKEFFDVREYADVAAMRQALGPHLRWHNHERTHHALGGILVPADRYYGRVEEVMRLVEGGATKAGEDPHEISLSNRLLDLFKVVSTGGRPEVWLLGQRIL